MLYFMVVSYKKMKKALKTDFGARLDALDYSNPVLADYRQIYQVVLFATYGEELNILLPSVKSVVDAKWEHKRKIIVLAGEERDKERLNRIGDYLKKEFSGVVKDILVYEHPDGIEGEVRGKGAGCTWAGKQLSKYIEEKNINDENVIVTVADADTRFPSQYLNYLAFEFVQNPNRHRRSYQPIPLFSNNIWHVPSMSRLAAWGSSFWQMIEASRPWRLVNFSTHAYSLKMLREMGYWSVDVVNEDSRQFWNAYYAFSGDHSAVPLYMPIYMDAVLGESYAGSMKNLYKQKRRWAYGVEHLPFIVTQAIEHKEIPFTDKWVKIWRLIEGAVTWSTASFYLTIVGWLPIILSDNYRSTVLAFNFSTVSKFILSVAWIGLIASLYISISFLPTRPKGMKSMKYVEMALEWILTPISALFFSSIPALEGQTRLMLGKYMVFWVTPKKAVDNE